MNIDDKCFQIDPIHDEPKQIIYGEMEYQIDDAYLNKLITSSYYFNDNWAKYHKQKKIYLPKEPIDITESAFNYFILLCQREKISKNDIFKNKEIIIQLYYLSIKYRASTLTAKIYDYISKKQSKISYRIITL